MKLRIFFLKIFVKYFEFFIKKNKVFAPTFRVSKLGKFAKNHEFFLIAAYKGGYIWAIARSSIYMCRLKASGQRRQGI